MQQIVAALETTPLWQTLGVGGMVMGVIGMVGKRIVGAFDKLIQRVDSFQTIMASHEREDVTRFAGIEDRASVRHEAVIAEVRAHADKVTVVTTDMSIRLATVEGIVERREKPRTPRL